MKKRVADIVMDTLADLGIEQAFCVVGGGSMYLNNALGISKRIKTIYCHHEQACAMAAEGYAKYKCDRPALVLVTAGPGGTNTLTGVMGAYLDSIPMIVISGQCRYNTSVQDAGLPLRTRGVQEFDIVNTVKTMTKYSKLILDPCQIKQEVYRAYDYAMHGRRGPVWLDIPQNVQNAFVEEDDILSPNSQLPIKECDSDAVRKVFDKLSSAKRPCIMAGGGIRYSGNYDAFLEFLKHVRVPVVTAGAHPDTLYRNHDLCMGVEGLLGQRGANFVIQNADVILALGVSFTHMEVGWSPESFAPNAYVISVNIDEFEHRKPKLRVNAFLHGDIGSFFSQAKDVYIDASNEWMCYANALKQRFDPLEGRGGAASGRVNSYDFWHEYSMLADEYAITCLGNSSCISGWIAHGSLKAGQRSFLNTKCGSMGDDLTLAEGVSVASDKPVTLITGDGSIMMNLQELATIRHNNLNVKIVLFLNDGYNALRKTFATYFKGVNVGCDNASGISFPDFGKVAEAFNIPYHHCGTKAELADSIKWLLKTDGAAILLIDEEFERPCTPRVASRLREDGTAEPALLQDMSPFLDRELYNKLMISEQAHKL